MKEQTKLKVMMKMQQKVTRVTRVTTPTVIVGAAQTVVEKTVTMRGLMKTQWIPNCLPN